VENLGQDAVACRGSHWVNCVAGHLAGLQRFFFDFIRRGALRDDIAQLERIGRLEAILEDIGPTRWEMNKIVRGYPAAERLLPTMAYRQDIEPEVLDARTLYALRHTCSLCDEHRACRRWLSNEKSAGQPDFCPNAALFRALRDRGRMLVSSDSEISGRKSKGGPDVG
jgi:hypothetical protein